MEVKIEEQNNFLAERQDMPLDALGRRLQAPYTFVRAAAEAGSRDFCADARERSKKTMTNGRAIFGRY